MVILDLISSESTRISCKNTHRYWVLKKLDKTKIITAGQQTAVLSTTGGVNISDVTSCRKNSFDSRTQDTSERGPLQPLYIRDTDGLTIARGRFVKQMLAGTRVRLNQFT